jgi:hypothetical protein
VASRAHTTRGHVWTTVGSVRPATGSQPRFPCLCSLGQKVMPPLINSVCKLNYFQRRQRASMIMLGDVATLCGVVGQFSL